MNSTINTTAISPAPWRVIETQGPLSLSYAISGPDGPIAHLDALSRRKQANAVLIAAAPELLATGDQLCRAIADTFRHGLTDRQHEALRRSCELWQATAAKAEGRCRIEGLKDGVQLEMAT